jgi:cobalt-zinc-cadmium efflux system protein
MSAHIIINEGLPYNETLQLINGTVMANYKIHHTTIQIEMDKYKEPETHV